MEDSDESSLEEESQPAPQQPPLQGCRAEHPDLQGGLALRETLTSELKKIAKTNTRKQKKVDKNLTSK